MSLKFCTVCGHRVSTDTRFCDECGAVFDVDLGDDRKPNVVAIPAATSTTRDTVAKNARLVISSWVIPINATLVFGSTLVAVFDFLSPRVVLLPIASSIAVVGLLAALALRKFVAPSLPMDSAFRRALAPEAGLHKSPMLIAIALLSALMVSGTAWSVAASANGGIIASKFDVAKNAQMQLGILQVVQKEQRVQTAVLEDIREGRTLNPRRELSNQGILWTYEAFDAALQAKDLAAVTLFISGGMTWGPHAGLLALWSKQDAISDQLISRPELLDRAATLRSRYGCANYIQVFNQPTKETEKLKDSNQIRPHVLREQDKQWLKLFCGDTSGKETAMAELQDQMAQYTSLPATQCRQRLTNNDASAISFMSIDSTGMFPIPFERNKAETATLRQAMLEQPDKDSSYTLTPMTPENNRSFPAPSPDTQPNPNRSKEAGKKRLTPQVLEAINDYCSMVSRRPAAEYNGWTVESMKQIVAALD